MSSKAIFKVQDDIKSLKQLLSVSASGLQRQALAIDKLKLETAQVFKKNNKKKHISLCDMWISCHYRNLTLVCSSFLRS